MYDQYKTECPNCDADSLIVTEVTLEVNGERVSLNVPLHSDGFEVDVEGTEKNGSTEDERVLCTSCKTEYDLCDLFIEESDKYINHYRCPRCKTEWQDRSPYTNNDRCPKCDLEIEPHTSEDIPNCE